MGIMIMIESAQPRGDTTFSLCSCVQLESN